MLADFGLTSENTSDSALHTTEARGSNGYRAPEILHEGKITNKVDVWAFGCILFEVAVGKKAFSFDIRVPTDSEPAARLDIAVNESFLQESRDIIKSFILDMLKCDPPSRPTLPAY